MKIPGWLSTIGRDARKVFAWLGSAQGQKTVQTTEAVVETGVALADPPVAPEIDAGIALFNDWAKQALQIETVATAAGQVSGTGAQKAASVIQSMEPFVQQYASKYGAPAPTQAQLAALNNAAVAFLDNLPVATPPALTQVGGAVGA